MGPKGSVKKITTATLLQMENVECGAAALAIVLAYYKKYVSLEELRLACKVSRSGTKASHIVQAARSYGLHAVGAQALEIGDLKEVKPPFIAFWEFNHFVVIEGFKNNRIYINDPARGRLCVDLETFSHAYTGIILMFEPTAAFQKDAHKPQLWLPYIKELKGSLDGMTFVTLLSLFLIVPGIIVPGFSKIYIDDILVKGYVSWFAPLLWGMLLTALVRLALTWLQQTYMMKLQIKLITVSANVFMQRLLTLPLRFFQQRYAGDILERVAANERIATFFSTECIGEFVNVVSFLFFGIVLVLYSWKLFFAGAFILSLNILLVQHLSRKMREASHVLTRDMARLSATEMNTLSMMETVKASGLENALYKLWSGQQADVLASQQNLQLQSRHFVNVPSFLTLLCQLVLMCFGSALVIQGHLTVGTLVAFQTLYASFQEPFLNFLKFFERFQKVQADLNRQQDVHHHPEDTLAVLSLTSKPPKEIPIKLQGALDVTDVTFAYDAHEAPTLDGVTVHVRPHKSLGIVGPSGSGKSTLIKVMLGLYAPQEGTVAWDGQPLLDIPVSTLRASIGYTDLSVSLFEGSVEENLQALSPNASRTQMERVLKEVDLYDTLAKRQGLQTLLLEGGANLSVGQCQRLEIAKALLHDPSILIFDEATSALDSLTEKKIFEYLKTKKMSFIVVSHRLSAVKSCDEIVVLEKGKLLAQGSHESLMGTCELYQQLMAREGSHVI